VCSPFKSIYHWCFTQPRMLSKANSAGAGCDSG
jgi:hypothetical protein